MSAGDEKSAKDTVTGIDLGTVIAVEPGTGTETGTGIGTGIGTGTGTGTETETETGIESATMTALAQ